MTNSRTQHRQNAVWRRRRCTICQAVFTTQESIDLTKSLLVRSGSSRDVQAFSRDRLFVSLLESCGHRPTAFEDAAALAATLTSQLLPHASDGAVERDSIVQLAQTMLQRFDATAATLYAAYHPLSNSD